MYGFSSRHVQSNFDLRKLDLTSIPHSTEKDIEVISDNCRDLRRINLTNLQCMNDSSLDMLTKRCKFIHTLILKDCVKLTDQALQFLSKNASRLENISFENCSLITDVGLQAFAKGCSDIRSLNLNGVKNITDHGLEILSIHCQFMTELCLSWSRNITDRGIIDWAKLQNIDTFHSLDISGCHQITSNGIIELVKILYKMSSFKVDYNNKLSVQAGIAMTHNLLQCKVLSLMEVTEMNDQIFHFDLNDGRSLNRDNMLRQLEEISLTDCNLITTHGLRAIGNRCSSLKKLILHGCEQVT